jgi:hypothetical protein
MMKRSLMALALVAPLAVCTLPATAAVDLVVKVAPPAPRVEVVPAPRVGYVWAPGYWGWRGGHHVWIAGTWQHERKGYVYTHPAWVQRDGAWHLNRGGWARHDRDGDGIPNAVDNHPNKANRP